MTRMAGPDCADMCYLIRTHTNTHTHNTNRTRVVNAMWETGRLGWEEKKRTGRQERVGSVAANPDNLENNKEAGGEAQGTQGLSKNCTRRESVSPLLRLIRGFRNKYHYRRPSGLVGKLHTC